MMDNSNFYDYFLAYFARFKPLIGWVTLSMGGWKGFFQNQTRIDRESGESLTAVVIYLERSFDAADHQN